MRTFATLWGAVARRIPFRTSSRPIQIGRRSAARLNALIVATAFGLALTACGDSDTIIGLAQVDEGRLLANASLLVVRGASQEGEVSATLDGPIVLEVRDITTATMANVVVEWVFQDGQGIGKDGNPADTVRVTTGSNGQASVTWQLDTFAGEQTANARIVRQEAPTVQGEAAGLTAQEWLQLFARGRPGALRSISIGPDNPALNVGDSILLTASGRDRYGNVLTAQPLFTWRSSATGVARVDARGVVTAVGGGTTTVTASSGSISGHETVTVAAPPPPPPPPSPRVALVHLDPAGATLATGDTARFTVTALDSVGNTLPTTGAQWGTRGTSVASVNSSGLVTALGPGSDSVWASVSGVRGARFIAVIAPAQRPGGVTDLATAAVTGNSVRLRWTQVSDGTGAPARYALRLGTPSISWGAAGETDVRLQGTQVGSPIEYTWTGLAAGTSYGFQVVAYREGSGGAGIYGVLSNIVSATTTAAPVSVVGIDVQPNSASGAPSSVLAFTATARMSDGSMQPAQVTWSATGGTATTSGVYMAGSAAGVYRIVGRHALGFADTSAVTITAPPPPPPPGSGVTVGNLFSARWTNGTGAGTTAISDGGKFSRLANGTSTLDVVTAASVGANTGTLAGHTGGVLRMRMRDGGWGQMTAVEAVPQRATHYARVYYRSDAGRRSRHGSGYIASAGGGSFNHWQLQVLEHNGGADASAPLRWSIRTGGAYPQGRFNSPDLTKGTWYRFEWQVVYVTPTTVHIHPRIYDLAGKLLYDSDDFRGEDGAGGTLAQFYSTHTITLGAGDGDAPNADEARDFTLGLEDPADASGYNPATPAYIYVTGLDFSSTGWLGR